VSKLAYDVPDVEAQTFDGGPLPSPEEGWTQKRNPALQTVGYRRVKLNTGLTRKYFRQVLRKTEVIKLRKRAKAVQEQVKRDTLLSLKKQFRIKS
jgi:hypothetical protein